MEPHRRVPLEEPRSAPAEAARHAPEAVPEPAFVGASGQADESRSGDADSPGDPSAGVSLYGVVGIRVAVSTSSFAARVNLMAFARFPLIRNVPSRIAFTGSIWPARSFCQFSGLPS